MTEVDSNPHLPEAKRLMRQLRAVYPTLIETQMLLDRTRVDDPPSRGQLRAALKAEIGEMLNAMKPAWVWWKRGDKDFEEGDVLDEAADVMHFALALDIRDLFEMYLEAEGEKAKPFSEFGIEEADPFVLLLADTYAGGWPTGAMTHMLSIRGNYLKAGEEHSHGDVLGGLVWADQLPFERVDCTRRSTAFYAQLIAVVGFSVERLVGAYFTKARKNLGRWGRDPDELSEVTWVTTFW